MSVFTPATVALDAPVVDAPAAPTTSRVALAKLGRFDHPRYGRFTIASMVESWKRNLATVQGGEVPFDLDHSVQKGKGSEAAAWIKRLEVAGDTV